MDRNSTALAATITDQKQFRGEESSDLNKLCKLNNLTWKRVAFMKFCNTYQECIVAIADF